MKNRMIISVIFLFAISVTALAQKMTVKDSDLNVLMEVNDEGDVGSITLPSGEAPSTTTYKLYNVDGALYWNGSELGMAGSAGGWTDDGTVVRLTTGTDKVGIGISSPDLNLDVKDSLGINGTRLLYLPDQTDFEGTLILGDGGCSLSHTPSSYEGQYNTAVGIGALNANNTGRDNMANGYRALYTNSTGQYNTASGSGALYSNTTGSGNTAIGCVALYYQQAGSNNTVIGYAAGTGTSVHNKSGNVFIGYLAGYNETGSNKLYIENSSSSSPLIGGDFNLNELYFNGNVGINKTSPGAALDVDGRIHAAAHAEDKGLRLPTNAGPPSSVTGTSEGDIVWDSSNDNLYVYDGSSFSQIGGGTGLWESGTNGVYEDDAGVIVGIDQAETLENSGFSLASGDLFIQDELGVEGNVYTDGSFVAGSSLSIADGSITQSAGSALSVTLGEGSGDDLIVDTSTLVVESDNDRVGIGNTSPTHTLDVAGKIGINGTQVLYLPGGDFIGTLYIGEGGGSLSHTDLHDGRYNTAVGMYALYSNETGQSNTASGYQALLSNTTGTHNTASGASALFSNNTGNYNTANGYQALYWNTTGERNIANGYSALLNNTTGNNNIGIGDRANTGNQGGSDNIIIGHQAGGNFTGHNKSGNVFIGYQAGYSAGEADNRNIFIGYQAGYSETDSCKLYIENSNSSSPLIGGDFFADELYFNGDVGVKNTSPSSELDVAGDIETGSSNAFYFGDPDTDGSWRIVRSGNNLVFERRESSSWVTKNTITP